MQVNVRSLAWVMLKQLIRLRFPQVRPISTEQLAQRLNSPNASKPLLLDARSREEYEVSHLQNAQWMDGEKFEQGDRLNSLPSDRPIITYCSVGYRSALLAQKLQEQGFANVANLEGSIFQWVNEGRPVYRQGQPVDDVHPYGGWWKYLLQPKS